MIVSYQVSNEFKEDCKSNFGTNRQGKIHIIEDNIDIVGENYDGQLVDFTIEDNCYVNDKFIGTTVAKKITVNILNPNNSINLENKEIQAFAGINGEYVPFGNFIIEKPDNEEVKEKTSFTGYDYMIKFNIPYKDQVQYPISLVSLLSNLCSQVGLSLGSTTFPNSNYMVLGNPFTNNEDCRTVLSNIAQLAGGFAKIGRDNKVYIKTLKNISNLLTVKYVNAMTVKELNLTEVRVLSGNQSNADETIDGNNYFDDFSKNDQWGELNSLVLGISSIEGENTSLDDKSSIAENGLTEITINDNYFLTSQEEREKVIVPMWNSLKGLKYLPFKTKYYGYPYLDSGDIIYIKDINDNGYISYVFNHTFTFNGSFSGNIETTALTKTQTAYKNTFDIKTKFKNVERSVDKINGQIVDIVEQQTETKNKLTKVEQDIDGITETISSVETKVETAENKAENAQNTANDAVSQITTTNEKLTQVKENVDGIIQTVSSVETQVGKIEETANNANQKADSAVSQIEVTNENVTKIEQNVNGITDSVTAIETNLNENYSTTEQMNSAIEQKAGSITSSVSESIENIQVGGTNLIPNSAPFDTSDYYISDTSSIELTLQNEETAPYRKCLRIRTLKQLTSTSGIYIYMTKDTLEEGKEYCFSIWLKATANTIVTTGYNAGGSTSFNVTTSWQKFTHKFTATATSSSKVGFPIYLPVNTIEGRQVFVHSIKLEEGNKVTAWSPAPEDDVKGFEFGTKIEQNSKYVQYAWNNESQNIKIENDNGNSTMGFYDNDTKFAEMGVNNVDNDRYISFGIPVNYGQNIQDGMAWGMQTPDGKFWPILYIKDFHMANKDAGDFSGNLVLEACNLLLEGINSAITCGNINITNAGVFGGVMFEDANTHQNLLTIMPFSSGDNSITILDKISFYKNSAGTNTLIIGLQSGEHCMMTDDGYFSCREVYSTGDISCSGNIKAFNHIYCNNGVEPFSLAEKKRDIEKYNNKALDEVLNTDIYYYNYKEDAKDIKRRVGAIIGEDYKCSKEIVGTEGKGIDIYSMLSLSYKAIQEQQELIEKQNNTIKDLQDRIEKLEQKVGVANE